MTTRRTYSAILSIVAPIAILTILALSVLSLPQWETPHAITTPGYADKVAAAHDCWTGEAPAGAIAGHVVARRDDDLVVAYYGRKVTEQALSQLFDGADYGFTIHAFCR